MPCWSTLSVAVLLLSSAIVGIRADGGGFAQCPGCPNSNTNNFAQHQPGFVRVQQAASNAAPQVMQFVTQFDEQNFNQIVQVVKIMKVNGAAAAAAAMSAAPTLAPTVATAAPTFTPTVAGATAAPTLTPTLAPTLAATNAPTLAPTAAPSVQIEVLTFYMSVKPVPKVAVRQQIVTQSTGVNAAMQSASFQSKAWALTYSALLEYVETNNVAGFQVNNDTLVNKVSLATNLFENNVWTPFATTVMNITAMQAVTVTNGNLTTAQTTTQTTGQIMNFQSCRTDIGKVCFTYRISSVPYAMNANVFVPNAVKTDIAITPNANGPFTNAANSMLAMMSSAAYTADMVNIMDLHNQVNAAVAQAQATGQVAFCTPDLVLTFASAAQSGFMNFNRVAVATQTVLNANGTAAVPAATTTANVNVNQQIVAQNMMQDLDNFQYGQVDATFNFMAQKSYVIYSFLTPAANLASLNWDPEVGIDAVSTTNTVGPANGATGSAGNTAGIVAGVVVAVVAVVAGAAGVVYWRKTKRSGPGDKFVAMN